MELVLRYFVDRFDIDFDTEYDLLTITLCG